MLTRGNRVAACVALMIACASVAIGADRTWIGGNSDWGTPTNWDPPSVPGADDRAIINAGASDLPFATTITGLNLGGGSLVGTGNLTVTGASLWTAGRQSGVASTTFNSGLAISGATTKTIFGHRILNLNGTTTWSGNTGDFNNAIQFWNGGTLNNNGTFNDANAFASFIEHNVGGPHNFNNIGTYNKQSNTITTVDGGVAFNNSGTVNVDAGILRPSGGTSTGRFNIASGATLEFVNGTNTLNNVTMNGPGTFKISSDNVGADATVILNGGTVTTPFLLAGSVLTGSDHVLQGPAIWTGGAISSAGNTAFNNSVTISGPNTKTIFGGRTVNLHGTTTWSGNTADNTNAIRFWNGGTLNNHGTFNDANTFASFIEHNVSGPHNFVNIGTYNKTQNTETRFDLGVVLQNTTTGIINVDAGTVHVASAMTNDGLINVAAGATFHGNSATFLNVGTLAGNGTFATHVNGDIANQGIIDPGTLLSRIGHLTFAGDLTQATIGQVNIDLANLASFDHLTVTDDVTLRGTIIAKNAGYVPKLGDRFVVMVFDERLANSEFDGVTTLGYGAAIRFDAIYYEHSVSLVVAVVPEPETYALMLAGLVLVVFATKRVKR